MSLEELVEIAGGDPIFPELSHAGLARDRIVDPSEVARRNPEVIFASWCGKRVRKETIRTRPGWSDTAAVAGDRIFEVKSTYILQPGPASLTEGVRQLHALFARVHGIDVNPALAARSLTEEASQEREEPSGPSPGRR